MLNNIALLSLTMLNYSLSFKPDRTGKVKNDTFKLKLTMHFVVGRRLQMKTLVHSGLV